MKNEYLYVDGNEVYWRRNNYYNQFGFWYNEFNLNCKHIETQPKSIYALTRIITKTEHKIIKRIRDEVC